MVLEKEVVHNRVASVTGVPMAEPQPTIPPSIIKAQKRPIKIPVIPAEKPRKIPPRPLKRIIITKERGDLTKSGYIYKAMTNLGEKASQLNYNVVQRGLRGEELIQKVTNKQTTPEGEISGMVPELVDPTVPSEIRERKNAPVRVPKVYIKWEEQQIGEDTYAKGRSPGYFAPPHALPKPLPPATAPVTPVVTPKPPVPPKPPVKPPVPPVKDKVWYFDAETLICKEAPVGESISKSVHTFKTRSECQVALARHKLETRREARVKPAGIARPLKRELSARVEELMKKRGFPKAVKEAIEKGIEQKDAPRNIERIIEKVAKTNEPDYILRRTIAKRIGTRGTVQYKVETDKGEIIYENADEKTVNAILGMPGPRGEIIPLQIKVIRE